VRKTNTCFQAKGFYVFLRNNWFLMPIGSEAVSGRSPDPSRAEPCRADPNQCAPSLTVSPTCSIIGLSLTAVEMCMVEKTIPLSSTLHTRDATSDITQFPVCSPCDFCGLRKTTHEHTRQPRHSVVSLNYSQHKCNHFEQMICVICKRIFS
jgi:hypothetical protein